MNFLGFRTVFGGLKEFGRREIIMAQVLPAGDKIKDYDSRVDPDAPAHEAKVCVELAHIIIY